MFIILHLVLNVVCGYRLLLTKSCRRKTILQYFGEDVTADTCCTSLGGALCDNCEKLQGDSIQLISRTLEFSIVADAISDLPNYGIHKVRLPVIYEDCGIQSFSYRPVCGSVVLATKSSNFLIKMTKPMEREEEKAKNIGQISFMLPLVMVY